MFRKLLICLLAILAAAMLPCAAMAEDPASLPEGYLQFSGELPEILKPVFSGVEWADDKPLTGYVFTRCDEWNYAHVIMEGDTGRTLCCMFWYQDHWEMTASSAAIPQDGTPVFEFTELEWYPTEEKRDQYNVGYDFYLHYKDSASPFTMSRWFCGANGWQLQSLIGYQTSVQMRARELVWNGESIYNTQDIMLENFVLADFPTTIEAARALAAANPELNDITAGIVIYTDDAYSDWGRSDVCPCAPVYAQPSYSAKQVAWMADDTAVTVLEERDGFVHIRVGDIEPGWVPRENVLIGLERSSQYLSCSRVRVLSAAQSETEPIYDAPDGAVCGEIGTLKAAAITIMDMEGEWVYVTDTSTGVSGWLSAGKAGLTDNYATCVIFNDAPENRLHLRAEPSKNAESLGKYYTGVTVDMLWQEKAVDGWRKVSIEGVVGWMNTDYLSFASNGNYSDYLPPLREVRGAAGDGANMRSGPGKTHDVIRRLPNGTPVEILGVNDGWGYIRLKDGTTGWMQLHLLGGEPERADSGTVKLLHDVTAESLDEISLSAGTRVTIQDRPIAQWHSPNWLEGDYDTKVYDVPEETYVYISDETGAWVPTDAIDCGW